MKFKLLTEDKYKVIYTSDSGSRGFMVNADNKEDAIKYSEQTLRKDQLEKNLDNVEYELKSLKKVDEDLSNSEMSINSDSTALSDMRHNETYKVLENICNRYKIKLMYAFNILDDNNHLYTFIQLDIDGEFAPTFVYDSYAGTWKITPAKKDDLTLEEASDYIFQLNNAYSCVSHMQKEDYTKLYIYNK